MVLSFVIWMLLSPCENSNNNVLLMDTALGPIRTMVQRPVETEGLIHREVGAEQRQILPVIITYSSFHTEVGNGPR